MSDYLTQCNAIPAEKKVWRWARFVSTDKKIITICREDDPWFVWKHRPPGCTEYDGDEYGNPIQAMLGPKKYVIAADMHGWYIAFDEHTRRCFGFGDAAYSEAVILRDRLNASAIAEPGGSPAMLGPQELWDKYKIRVMVGVNGSWLVDRVEDGIYCVRLAEMIDTYASAIAEANRIAGGAA